MLIVTYLLITEYSTTVSCVFLIAEEFFLNDPELRSPVPMEYLSHKEKYEEAVRLSCLLFKKINKWLSSHESGNTMEAYQ